MKDILGKGMKVWLVWKIENSLVQYSWNIDSEGVGYREDW